MRRFLAFAVGLLALVAAGFLWTRDRPVAVATEVASLPPVQPDAEDDARPLVAPVSSVTLADREARGLRGMTRTGTPLSAAMSIWIRGARPLPGSM